MNVLFCSMMEQQKEGRQTQQGRVQVTEREGIWLVGWEELLEDGDSVQEFWFEGEGREEALAAFRTGMQTKSSLGFAPLVSEAAPRALNVPRNVNTLKLYYYSEKHLNPEAFQALRLWRKERAAQEGRSAFLVAGNRLLQMLSTFLPRNEEELRSIPGFGDYKLRMYGEAIVGLLQPYFLDTGFPLDWVAEQVDEDGFAAWLEREAGKKESAEQKKQETKRLLLEAVADGQTLEEIGRMLTIERREIVPLIEELERGGYDMTAFVEKELQSIGIEEQAQADRLFTDIGDRYLKPVAIRIYSEEAMKGKEAARIYEWLRLYRLKFRRKSGEPAACAV